MKIMKNKIFLKIILMSLFLLPGRAFAEFEELGTSARAAGMGNCFVAVADDAYSILYNPAGLGRIHHKEIVSSSSRLYWGLSDLTTIDENFIGGVYGTSSFGTVGIGMKRLAVSELYNENTAMISYGKAFGRRLSLGANIKNLSKGYNANPYTENAIDFTGSSYGRDPVFANGYSKSILSYDAGGYYQISDNFSAGLAASDINRPDTGLGSVSELPATLKAGLCYKDDNLLVPFEV